MKVLISLRNGPEREYKISGPEFMETLMRQAALKGVELTIRSVE